MSKSALGRGLGALLGEVSPMAKPGAPASETKTIAPGIPGAATSITASSQDHVQRIPLERLQPSSLQPRKDFTEEALRELADSIHEKGILQPLIVRKRGNDYELIAGERRWRAAQMVGLKEVPVLVREADDHNVLEMMLIENLQRENLNSIEEALGYQQLISQFKLRQEDVALKVGKNRVTVANALRLLKLPPEIQVWIRQGQLSVGHAKVILALTDAEDQYLAAQKVLKDGLSVREAEDLVAHWGQHSVSGAKSKKSGGNLTRDAHLSDLENRIQQRFGTKVQLKYHQGKGAVTIRFFNDDDLARILELFSVKVD